MKKVIIGILVVGVAVGGYFLLTNKKTSEVKNESEGKKMAFEAFLKNDSGAYVCTVNQYVGDTESKGTVYIANGPEGAKISERNIRGEFKTSVQGMEIDSTFIMTDGFSYTWSSMMPNVGYKIKIEEGNTENSGNTNTNTSGTYSFDATQIGDYDCKEWIVEPGKFALPSTVKFTDLNTSASSQTLPKTTTSTTKTTVTTETKTTTTSNTTTSTKKTSH